LDEMAEKEADVIEWFVVLTNLLHGHFLLLRIYFGDLTILKSRKGCYTTSKATIGNSLAFFERKVVR
jgi:hypothetical protein